MLKRTRHMNDLINRSGLRIRLFIYNIGRRNPSTKYELNEFFINDISLDVDFFNDTAEEIIDQMNNSKFIGYASIIIIVSHIGKGWRRGFDQLLQAMANNRNLRYKSKLLLMPYGIDGTDDTWDVVFNSYVDSLEEDKLITNLTDFLYPRYMRRKKFKKLDQNINRFRACRDYENFHSQHFHHTVMMQTFIPSNCSTARTLDALLYDVFSDPFQSMQKLLTQYPRGDLRRRLVQSTTNADLYFYEINPALAIIINNYYFTTPQHKLREGSDRDVVHLIRVLKLAGIPYILVEDSNCQELLHILDYMATKDFTPLKSLLVFLMSHGDEHNVFYTYDGQLNINTDIVDRLQANRSLIDVKKLVVVNACRGSVDLLDGVDDDDDEDENVLQQLNVLSDDRPNLMHNTIVLYGVPNGIKSPRSDVWGSPFIQSFCRYFGTIDPTDDVRMIDAKINKDLSQRDYFHGLEKCSDWALKDPKHHYTIMQVPMQALQMLKLLESIANDFPGVCDFTGGKMLSRFLYVCAALNSGKFPKKWNYFAPELEYERYDDVEHNAFYKD